MGLERITEPVWTQLNDAILWLVLTHLSVVLFAGSMMMAKAIIPSLVNTNDAPDRAARLIPVFYISALVGFVGIVLFATLFANDAGVSYDLYDRVWI